MHQLWLGCVPTSQRRRTAKQTNGLAFAQQWRLDSENVRVFRRLRGGGNWRVVATQQHIFERFGIECVFNKAWVIPGVHDQQLFAPMRRWIDRAASSPIFKE